MARVGYCRHGTHTGYGDTFRPCDQCITEAAAAQRKEEARIEEIRRIVNEELDKRAPKLSTVLFEKL